MIYANLSGWEDQQAWSWQSKELNSRSLTLCRLFCRSMPVLTMIIHRMTLVCVYFILKWKWWEAAPLGWCNAIQRCRRGYFATKHAAWTFPPHPCQQMAAGWMQNGRRLDANTCRQELGEEVLGRLYWPNWQCTEMRIWKSWALLPGQVETSWVKSGKTLRLCLQNRHNCPCWFCCW